MTRDELEALPIGYPGGKQPLGFWGPGKRGDDLLCFESSDGYVYHLEQADDGTWFRERGIL